MSQFDPKELHTNKKLGVYFDKGLLVNLGNATPTGSIAALKSARNRISKLGLNDYVIKHSTSQSNNRKKIGDLIRKSNPRNQPKQGFDSKNERYSDEYYNNMNPGTTREDFSQPKPHPKIEDSFRNMQISDGIVSEFGSYGKIQTGVLTPDSLSVPQSPPIKKPDAVAVTDKDGNVYQVSLKVIEDKIRRKCIGTTSSGKLCKKYAVHNFQSCLTHMSLSEKKAYENLKKTPK